MNCETMKLCATALAILAVVASALVNDSVASELLREIAVAAVFGTLVRRPGDIALEPIEDASAKPAVP